jgi:hypothetical protein
MPMLTADVRMRIIQITKKRKQLAMYDFPQSTKDFIEDKWE